jgi:hypothetical protein
LIVLEPAAFCSAKPARSLDGRISGKADLGGVVRGTGMPTPNGGQALTAALTATGSAWAGLWTVFSEGGGYPQDLVGGPSCL